MHALSKDDYEAAAACVHQDADDPWDALRFKQALAPYFEEYAEILFTPDARNSRRTLLKFFVANHRFDAATLEVYDLQMAESYNFV